jgi:hypothetical protein
MFHRIKKALSRQVIAPEEGEGSRAHLAHGPVSEWASTQGFGFTVEGSGNGIALDGKVSGKTWRLELSRPTRNYIFGEEVRARAELGLDEKLAVLIMNRPLREALEKKAYQIYTDPLQTTIDPNLPEEMRWLAMFDEVGWDSLPREFWDRYSVLTDCKEDAMAWVSPALAGLLLEWPNPGPSLEVPFMMLLLRGKAYLRMEYTPAGLPTLRHAALIFTTACERALGDVRAA